MSHFPITSKYYSATINSYLTEFVAEHRLISNQIPNKWQNVKPFQKEFTGIKKTGSVYAMHRYWTKQPISVIKEYITHFCPPQGIVLDPFCGTGTTGTAALFSNRYCILSDLSPVATFIAKNYTESTNLSEISTQFIKLHNKLKSTLRSVYSTICINCKGRREVKDWLFSEVYTCKVCQSPVPFIPANTPWEEIKKKKRQKNVKCPNCQYTFSRAAAEFQKIIPIGIRYACQPCKFRKQLKPLDTSDTAYYQKIENQDWHPFVPQHPLPSGVNTSQPLSRKIHSTHQFFTKNTAQFLGELWKEVLDIPDPVIKSKFQFIFTSIVYRVSRLYRLRVDGQGGILSGTLYLPPIAQDINVWDVFTERYKKIVKGWQELNLHISALQNNRIISTQSATHLVNIPDNSIDYVYTDPPYGGNINYSELNLLWEAWFGLTTNSANEIIINEPGQSKTIREYQNLLQQSLLEIYRVLKSKCWLTLVFNTSSPKIWSVVQRILFDVGFVMGKDISTIKSKMTTAKQTESKKTARRYILINVQKPDDQSSQHNLQHYSVPEFEEKIKLRIFTYLRLNNPPQAPYDEIYDDIITILLPQISIQHFDLEQILNTHFTKRGKDLWSINSF